MTYRNHCIFFTYYLLVLLAKTYTVLQSTVSSVSAFQFVACAINLKISRPAVVPSLP